MDEWEIVIQNDHDKSDPKIFCKVLRSAKIVLDEDLAPFETEWILSTLLHKPVNLLKVVANKRTDSTWDNFVRDALKLLGEIVTKHACAEKYYEQIVQLCLLHYEPLIKQQALSCLTRVALRSPTGAQGFTKHLSALQETTTCKAPLAILVGAICEHHPSVVADEVTKVWRVYLINLVDSNKYTVTVTKALLEGVSGLFKHFGSELPTMELNEFYDKLVTYLELPKCEEVTLKFFEKYASLFRERIASDKRVRTLAWQCNSVCARPTILALYRVAFDAITDVDSIQKILETEIYPRTKSSRFYERFTALRVLTDARARNILTDLNEHVHLQALEGHLRNGNVDYETCEAISWSVQSKVPFSERVLQSAILFYDQIPANKRTEVVVHSLLKADKELRTSTTNFLIAESIQPANKEQCLKIWHDLFDTKGNTDSVVMENSMYIAQDVIEYVDGIVDNFVEADETARDFSASLPEAMPPLLSLLVLVLRLSASSDLSASRLARVLRRCAHTHPYAAPAAILCGLYSGVVYEDISFDQCTDEDMLLQCALTLLAMSDDVTGRCLPKDMITALELIFSSKNIESSILSKAVQELGKLLQKNSEFDDKCTRVIQNVVKLSQRIDRKCKNDRILYWDIVMFLGKYGKQYDFDDHIGNSDNLLIYKLNSTLNLDIPNEDGTLKINLQGILHSAIIQEDPDALKKLLTIITANLATRKDPVLQTALVRVVLSLSHCEGNDDVIHTAVSLCDGGCANEMMRFIALEKSQKSRKILLEAMEMLLRGDGQILENIMEYVVSNESDLQNQSQTDIEQFSLKQLKDNNSLCQKYLSKIIWIILSSDINNCNTLKMASDLFFDKIGLYKTYEINYLLNDGLVKLNSSKCKNMLKINGAVEFIKRILENKDDVGDKIEKISDLFLDIVIRGPARGNMRVYMAITQIFGIDKERINTTVFKHNVYALRHRLKHGPELDHFDAELILDLYCEYNDIVWNIDHGELLDNLMLSTPQNVVKFDKKLSKYISSVETTHVYRLKEWFMRKHVKEITQSIERYVFLTEHEIIVQLLKIMANVYTETRALSPHDMKKRQELSNCIKRWVKWIFKLKGTGYIEMNLKSKMAYLMDLVETSVASLSDEEFVAVLNEGESAKVKFLRDFMPAIYDRLLKKPYILLEPNMEECCTILNEVVRHASRKNRKEDVLHLVDWAWRTYDQLATTDQKHSLLLDLTPILTNLPPDSNVMSWVLKTISSEDTGLADKINLFGILPTTEDYSAAYMTLCPHLPSRLSELSGLASCCFQAVLDRLADSRDCDGDSRVAGQRDTLLDIVITLAASDNTKGWWDDAIAACMSLVAARADARLSGVCRAVYARCFEGRSLGVCTRLMLPLLRNAPPAFCEEFFSTVLEDLLAALKKAPRDATVHYSYEKCVLDYVRALYLLQLVYQKVPKESIESPRSPLYSKMAGAVGDTRSYAVSAVCKLCVALRTSVKCPPAADDGLKESCRLFYCANYNCLAAAICCTQLKPAICATVFSRDVWDHLIGDEDIRVPLRSQWNQRNTHQAVPIEVSGSLLSLRTSATLNSVRTPAFLRTLSENPFQFDLVADQLPQPQDLQLTDNYLNQHPCAGTLTALLSRVSALESTQWRDALIATLGGDAKGNVKWLLAQAVCNSKEDLKPHASALRPAMLAVVANTATDNKLNGLHIDIIDTLIFWNEAIQPSPDLNRTIECIIATAIDYRQNKNIYYMILDKLTKMLDGCVEVQWSCFERHLTDLKSDAAISSIDVLKRITKCNVYIPQLLPALTETLENKRSMSELATLFALALSVARDRGEDEGEWLKRYRSVLDKLRRSDHAQYIKHLLAAQRVFPGCCDEAHFRSITDLTPKITGRPKTQCLEILSTYVANARPSEYVAAMFDTIGLVDITSTKEALVLAKNGLHLMESHLRKRIVSQVADTCSQLPVKVRSEAYGVLVKALELLLSPEPTEPSAKRLARESNSILLSHMDVYTEIVCTAVAQGLVERDGDISKHVKEGVGRCLNSDSGVRFCESFLLAIVLPLKNTSKQLEGGSLAAMLDLFLQRIREQDNFLKAKLRDQPIETRQIILASMSTKTLTAGNYIIKQESSKSSLDVQISLDELLKSLLQFLEKNPTAAVSVITQLVKTYRKKRPGFDFDSIMKEYITKCLNAVCPITPWVLEIAREINIWDSSHLGEMIEKLVQNTKNTEGEDICKLVYEDYRIRSSGPELFLMGILDNDIDMSEEPPIFSLKDTMSCFGKLSNWDDLTSRERRSVKCSLPAMWTARGDFDACLQDYDFTDSPTWVKALVASYRNSDKSTFKWMTELDRWPRKYFDLSALMESTSWDGIRATCDVTGDALPASIHPADCLAEWAFRIMLRSSYLQSLNISNEEIDKLSHSYELSWCISANERGLYKQALECCKRVTGLYESETLRWLHQKVLALRGIALETNDSDGLKDALHCAETYSTKFIECSTLEDVIGMNDVTLRLKRDTQTLKHEDVDQLRNDISSKLKDGQIVPNNVSKSAKISMESICVTSLCYYNELWDTRQPGVERSDLLTLMIDVLDLFAKLDLGGKGRLLADMILDRLDDVSNLQTLVYDKLLNALDLLRPQLDEISIDHLTSKESMFPQSMRCRINVLSRDYEMGECRKCLSLLADPEYSLLQCCRGLRNALETDDDTEWSRIFTNMMDAIFDNRFAGPDYKVLFKYKKMLTDLNCEDISKEHKRKALLSIQSELKDTRKDTLYLSHLCPALTRGIERDDSMSRLLCLKKGVYVVEFEEKISVFVDSIRRPTLVRCRLSDGSVARFIVKSGERARPHRAALRLLTAARAATGRRVNTGYYLSALSDDCVLIQYLEEHERFKALINTMHDVDSVVSTIHRSKDSELILSPSSSLQTYEQLCSKVPAYLLRLAIEATCITVQDFIVKKRNFLESLCDMTVLSYLFGIGDRHLENMMYSIKDGGACHVDAGAILQYGGRELPPARLTRNVLAVCDLTVIESRLQSVLSSIRDSRELLAPAITVSFKWMNDSQCMDKLCHIKDLINGSTLSHKVTMEVLSKSNLQYKEKYVELLQDVFADFDEKQMYSIEEQVASLLRQSTEPRILSVTRSGWEPWI